MAAVIGMSSQVLLYPAEGVVAGRDGHVAQCEPVLVDNAARDTDHDERQAGQGFLRPSPGGRHPLPAGRPGPRRCALERCRSPARRAELRR